MGNFATGRHDPGRRWRQARALLAGGLVLGVGATATLAAWNDSEYAGAEVTASTFDVEGSVNGGEFSDHASAETAAELQFDPALPQISPGESGFLQFSVRTTSDSTAAGTVGMQTPTVDAAGAEELAAGLRYAVRVMPAGSACAAPLFESAAAPVVVPNGTELGAAVDPNANDLQAGAGNAVDYCVRISLLDSTDNGAQGESVSITWQFLAESS